jgi:hypothetical protein
MQTSINALKVLFALLAVFVAGCGSPLVRPGDAKETCHVTVNEEFGQAGFQSNVLSNKAGTFGGIGMGALSGLQGGWPGFVLTVPIGAIAGAAYGTACAVGSVNFPSAETDFQKILQTTDTKLLKTEIEARLNSSRAECTAPDSRDERDRPHGAVITIRKIEAGMGCLHGNQDLWVEVSWRTAIAKSNSQFDVTTKHRYTSPREVAGWFAHPDEARAEIEHVFVELGKDIAIRLIAREASGCSIVPQRGEPGWNMRCVAKGAPAR